MTITSKSEEGNVKEEIIEKGVKILGDAMYSLMKK